jgi:hypothetical protein
LAVVSPYFGWIIRHNRTLSIPPKLSGISKKPDQAFFRFAADFPCFVTDFSPRFHQFRNGLARRLPPP